MKPSRQVAAADALPGVLMRIAGIDPDVMMPLNTPSRNGMPTIGFMKKVNGERIATAMVAVTPGTAPTSMPAASSRNAPSGVHPLAIRRNPS